MIWNYVDRTIVNHIDEWVELTDDQHAAVNADVSAWLETVRADLLPRYVGFANRTTVMAEGGLTRSKMRDLLDEADALYRETVASALPWVSTALADLDSEQHERIAQRIQDDNETYVTEHLGVDPLERRKTFAENFIAQTERWTGTLDPRQRAQVRELSREFPETGAEWFEYRLRMQYRLMNLLYDDATATEINAHLHCWWVERCDRTAAEIDASERFMDGMAVMIVELDAILTPRQRNDALNRLRSRAGNLEALIE